MKSAPSAARRIGALTAAGFSVALLLVTVAPSPAQASSYGDVNPCVDMYYWGAQTEEDARKNRLTECAPATSGLFPVWNNNIIRPLVDMMNQYFRRVNVGGPVEAYRESLGGETPNAQQLARQIEYVMGSGPGMAAGYTPDETTGEFIQRHLQPLRNNHVNGWFNMSWTNPQDDHTPTKYDSDVWTLTLGADMPILDEQLLFGMFGSFTHSDVDSQFNNGDVESKLGTIGPYFVYSLNDMVSFDVTVAGVFGQHENTVGPPVPTGSTPTARGKQDLDGFFISMNANANYWIGNWGVQGRLGFLHSDMETDSYNLRSGGAAIKIPSANNELTQFSLASQFNYFMDGGLPRLEQVKAMPFFRITFNYDIDHDNIQLPFGRSQHPNDDDELQLNWGATLFGDSAFSGTVEGGTTVGRSHFEAWTFSGTLNYAF